MRRRAIHLMFALAATVRGGTAHAQPSAESVTIPIFQDALVGFAPDSLPSQNTPGLAREDKGRIVRTTADLPVLDTPRRITALLTVKPIPKGDREVSDRWDRAGNVRLVTPGRPDLEVLRFMTSYGGRTEHRVDVTALAPLLRGRREFRAFVDTWVNPGWKLDVSLLYEPVAKPPPPTWALPVYYTDSYDRDGAPRGDEVTIEVPKGLARVVLEYTATGHCTDGIDADEFISKANVISVDGKVVARFHPWRDDCRQFRDRNPFTSHWADGTWSSDYSRSGWCPGTEVLPVEFDLTDHLGPGKHRIRFVVEDVRPRDAKGNHGYWRISAYLVGWDRPPNLWTND